jgi:DNA polymerase-3 subunit epsilon
VDEWETLIDPESYFDGFNVSIHGIDEERVRGKPTLRDIASDIRSKLDRAVCVCHGHFDKAAIGSAFERYSLPPIEATWLDTAKVARRTWKVLSQSGYGLRNVCAHIQYDFQHHDALEDAKAAGHVLLAAMKDSSLDINQWLTRSRQPIDLESSSKGSAIERDGNPDGALYGEVVVFTGALRLPRREAATLAASIGCQVDANVTKKTTMLVVGDQDPTKLGGNAKSSKQRKAEQLVAGGARIRIAYESDFFTLVEKARNEV